MRAFQLILVSFSLLVFFNSSARCQQPERPNIVLIVADDMGYADMQSQGADYATPSFDQLAQEGTRFTNFYVVQPVCTASRAGFLSGCYPNRVGLQGALNHTSRNGIHPDEWLLPEMLKELGYATAMMGKWHLGTRPEFNPLNNGFDEWLGIPYSNDNSKFHPVLSESMPPLPFYDGKEIIEYDPDQSQFTKRFTDRAVSFIERNADQPFFLYMPHVMPHVPIFASEQFQGKSGKGLYADVIQELDWSVGEVLSALRRLKIEQNTLFVFFSDNGAWLSYGEHAGNNSPLREGKLTTFDGGVRVPCLIKWPERVPAGRVSDVPWMSIDLMPTITKLVGGTMPTRKIDGLDARDLLTGESSSAPHEALYFYGGAELQAVRSGPWKLHFAHPYITTRGEPGKGGKPSGWGTYESQSITQSGIEGIASRHGGKVVSVETSLFNLEDDPGETKNLASQYPEVVTRLSKLADSMRSQLGDALSGTEGREIRKAGYIE